MQLTSETANQKVALFGLTTETFPALFAPKHFLTRFLLLPILAKLNRRKII